MRNEEKEKRALQKQREELAKQCDYFFDVHSTDDFKRVSSPKKDAEQTNRTKTDLESPKINQENKEFQTVYQVICRPLKR